MWCEKCQKQIVDCECPDIEERLKTLRGTAAAPAAEINLERRRVKKHLEKNVDSRKN